LSEDGSGKGAALIAAVAARISKKDSEKKQWIWCIIIQNSENTIIFHHL
jgi:hypothetical protein